MKPISRFRQLLCCGPLLAVPTLQAATLYWDNNTTTAGFGTAGGTWSSTGSTLWNQDPAGATANGGFLSNYTTTSSDIVNFGINTTGNGLAAGTVTVSGTVQAGGISFGTQSGNITLSGGTIQLASSSSINLGGKTITMSSALSGAGTSLAINGGGILNFTAGNANFGAGGTATVSGGTTVRFSTGGFNGLGGSGGYVIQLGDTTTGGTLQIANTGTISNAITVAAGSGTRTLSNNGSPNPATFNGVFTVNENLSIVWNGSSNSLTIGGTNSKSIADGKTVSFNSTGTGGNLRDDAVWNGSGRLSYVGDDVSGIIISGAKTHSGGSTLGTMSSTGTIVLNSGSSGAANAPTSGVFGTGTLTLAGTRVRAGITADITVHNPISFTGSPTFTTAASEKSLIFTGSADLNGAARTLTVESGSTVAGKFVEFQGVISGANGIVKAGAGTLKLSGLNTYAGNTQINTGTLLAGADDTLPFGTGKSGVVLNGGATSAGTLDLNGFNLNINGLTGTGNTVPGRVVNNATGTDKTLTLGNGDATNNTFAGVIADNTSGTGTIALTKVGTGSQILSGANSYSGLTTIQAGALRITDPAALGTTTAGTIVNGGTGGTGVARLELSGGITVSGEAITIKGGGNFLGALSSFSGVNEWAGNVTVDAASTRIGASSGATLRVSGVISSGSNAYGITIRTGDTNSPVILSGANTYLGDTTITLGKLQLDGGDNRLPVNTRLIMGGGANSTEFDLNGRNQEISGLSLGASPTATNTVNNSSLTGSTLTVNTASASSFAGILAGNLGLAKKGASTLSLSGTNSFTGDVTVDQGTLIGSGSASGGNSAFGASSNSRTLNVNSGAKLRFDSGNVLSTNFASSAVPALNVNGGTVTNGGSASNNALGNITLAGGTLEATVGDATYGSWNLNGTVTSTGNSSITSTAPAGVEVKLASGPDFVPTHTTFNVQSGTLHVSAALGEVSAENKISGLTKTGNGSLILSGGNTYTGSTLVSGGTLVVNGNISTSTQTTVQSGATLAGSGTVGTLTIDAGGVFSPGNSPGIMTVDGDYTQMGTLLAEITGLNPGTQHDQVVVNGAVSLSGALSLASLAGFTPVNGDLVFLLLNDGTDAISGTFAGLSQGAVLGNYLGFDWQISYAADSALGSFSGGNDVALMAVAIPEPRAALLGGIGLLMLARRRR